MDEKVKGKAKEAYGALVGDEDLKAGQAYEYIKPLVSAS